MRYLGNNTNLVRDAALTATNAIGSGVIYRTDSAPKTGGGSVSLTGPYTGAEDTALDVEIVDLAGGTVRVSQPVFAGVGNGIMSGVAAADVVPQTVTVTLEDLGTDTRSAYAPFQGVTLTAKTPGAAGNAIAIDVDHGDLTSAPTSWALQDDLRQDANEYVGDHWNFGAAVLEPAGTIPTDAPRLSFGNDPQVYRQYKRYRDGRYVYSFAPAPVRDVPRGARVHAISGARTLTITDGGTSEFLSGLVTLYDALSAIRDQSDLVRVDGPIVNDRLPGGQGITELSVRTRSYVLGVTTSGSGPIERAELIVAAQDTAPTETLTLTCADAAVPGAEKWDLYGDVSGPLARATTGLAYADGKYTLTIPLPEIDPSATTGLMVVEYLPEGNHGENEPIPSLCVERPRLGAAARDGEWTFTYTRRPPDECDCSAGEMSGAPSAECLGIDPTTGGDIVSDASRLRRVGRLKAAVSELISSNTAPPSAADVRDVQWIQTSAQILLDCLSRLQDGTLEYPAWEPSKAYAVDEVAEPAARNGYRYAVKTPGTSGVAPPAWTATPGDEITDGTVTWECLGKAPYGMWDDLLVAWKAEADSIASLSSVPRDVWRPGAVFFENSICVPTNSNGHYYEATEIVHTSGHEDEEPLSGRAEPAWPTDGGTIHDSSHFCTITWTDRGTDDFVTPNIDVAFYARYRSMAGVILAAAGIEENFDLAGANGDGCWQDFDDADYWWTFDGSEPYLPIQTGHYYHAAKMGLDENGKPFSYSTREWGFGPRIGCPELLKEGDKLRIKITGASGSGGRGYQVGDAFAVRVNQAAPLPLGGGQTGDDTLTWSVVCSQDGRQPDYALVTTAPAPYSASIGGGTLGFAIAPGGIPFALGDRFDLAIEGGRFRWRRDGGAWSAPADIADTLLGDGLFAQFTGGAAPSWAPGDRWSFAAEATFGVGQARTPIDGEFAWEGSTTIDVGAGGPIVGVLIAAHRIPDDATITLLGSDDDFASTPLSVVVPWRRDILWLAVSANHAAYRIAIDRGGAARWLYLGPGTQMAIRTGHAELGRLTKRVRLPGIAVRRALAASVEHSALPQAPLDALLSMLEHAGEFDDRILGIVPNDAEAEAGLVRITDEPIEIEDTLAFQPRDPVHRRQSLTLQLEAVP